MVWFNDRTPRTKAVTIPTCRLQELQPDPLDINGATKASFVLVLAINPQMGHGPYRVIVTDFTTINHLDSFQRWEEPFQLDSVKLLNLDFYPEKLHALRKVFKRNFQQDLVSFEGSAIPFQLLMSKLCLLKVCYKVKIYNGVIEGRVLSYDHITRDDAEWHTDDQLRDLGKMVAKYARKMGCEPGLYRAMPGDFYTQNAQLFIPSQDASTQRQTESHEIQERHERQGIQERERQERQERRSQNGRSQIHENTSGSVSNSTIISNGYQSDHLFGLPNSHHLQPDLQLQPSPVVDKPIKEELNDFVPGNKYSDLEDDEVPDSLDSNLPKSQAQGKGSQNESSGGIFFADSLELHTFSDLKKMDLNIDNKVYTVEATIIGINPDNLSYICAKGYQEDGQQVSVTDPRLRPIELYLSSTPLQFVSFNDYLKVYIDPDQLSNLFNNQIELLYSKPDIITERIKTLRESTRMMRLYKRKLELNGNLSVVVWATKSI